MRGDRRGQSAVESMAVYGWGILIVVLAVVAISFFFGFNKTYIARQECTLGPGISCTDFYADEESIVFIVKNGLEWDLNSVFFTYAGCGLASNVASLSSGQKKIFVIGDCNLDGGSLFEKDDLYVQYTFAGNAIVHNKQFSLTTIVQDGSSQSFGSSSYNPDGGTLLLMKFDDVDGGIAKDETSYENHGTLTNFSKAVGLWRFNEGNGKNVIDDSDYGNDGILGNGICNSGQGPCPVWTAFGISGPALLFDGTDDFVSIPYNASLGPKNNITISAWIDWNNHPTKSGKEAVLSRGHLDPYGMIIMEPSTAELEAHVTTTATKSVKSSYTSYQDKWTHVAFTYNEFIRRLYINGLQTNTNTDTPLGSIKQNTNPLLIGDTDFPSDQQYHFNGTIDEVAIYNATLTADEIAWHNISKKAILYRGWAKGKYSGGMQFDGRDDYIDLGDDPDLEFSTKNFTLEAWIKLDQLPLTVNKNFAIFSKYGPSGQMEYLFFVRRTNNRLSVQLSSNGLAGTNIDANTALVLNQWYHVAVVKSGNTVSFFLNGNPDGVTTNAVTVPTSIYSGSAKVLVGDDADTVAKNFEGIIDELRVSNYARY